MDRIALIIKGHSYSEGEKQKDILLAQSYHDFFNSIAGGAWEENEIVLLDEPEFDEYAEIINRYKPSYAVTILIGHGAIQNDHQLFLLNSEAIVKPGQFILETEKQLIILESCRDNGDSFNWVDLENKIPKYPYGGYIREHINWDTSKQLFLNYLDNCETGIVVCFACSKNQSANNYIFSNELIQLGQNLFLDTLYEYQVFGILDMMPDLTETVNRKAMETCKTEQKPDIKGNINFPFAVSKFDLLKFEKDKLESKERLDYRAE